MGVLPIFGETMPVIILPSEDITGRIMVMKSMEPLFFRDYVIRLMLMTV